MRFRLRQNWSGTPSFRGKYKFYKTTGIGKSIVAYWQKSNTPGDPLVNNEALSTFISRLLVTVTGETSNIAAITLGSVRILMFNRCRRESSMLRDDKLVLDFVSMPYKTTDYSNVITSSLTFAVWVVLRWDGSGSPNGSTLL